MPLSFMTDTITVVRAKLVVRNGEEVRDWEHATEHTVHNVQVTPQSTSREFGGRTVQNEKSGILRGEYGADVEPGDRVIWNGVAYEIDGGVFRSKSPTGRASSMRCSLVEWEG